jgi:two-component system heavy metal sensor histidine kinase CusS
MHDPHHLLADAPAALAPSRAAALWRDDVRARAAVLDGGDRLELAVDGSERLDAVRQYWIVAGVLVLVFGVGAVAASTLMAGCVASMVRRVADQVGCARLASGVELRADGAPDEIRDVIEALQAELDRLRAESASIRVFTASLAHELRSPIQNMAGQAEVALLRQRTVEEYETMLRSQLDEIRAFGDAVDNLLAICTIRQGVHAETEEFDLAAEARIRLSRESSRAQRHGVHLAQRVEGQTRIEGDRESILRSLRNVVSNAVEWTPTGGHVSLAMEACPEAIIVTVDDGGPGIPEAERQRVFEPFVRGRTPSRARAGYGLGLAIAKAGVEGQGGRIEVGVSPAGGARFVMTFPRKAAGRSTDST